MECTFLCSRNGFHITHLAHLQVPFITYPSITTEVSVHLFRGIMTLKCKVTFILNHCMLTDDGYLEIQIESILGLNGKPLWTTKRRDEDKETQIGDTETRVIQCNYFLQHFKDEVF